MKDNDLVRVTRCINCCCFIPMSELALCGFSETFIKTGEFMKTDGYCDNINLWVNESDFCSQAEPKNQIVR